MRPISVQPRNTRLSFLNMRKASDPSRDPAHVNGDRDAPASSHGRSMSKDKDTAHRRTSFFRAPPAGDLRRAGTGDQSHHSYTEGRRPSEASGRDEQASDGGGGGGAGLIKRGSVRKRLSLLKLGKKSSKAALMGSLDEE